MEDSSVRSAYSPSSIRSKVHKEAEPAPETGTPEAGLDRASDKVDPLPKPGDPYKVAGRHGNKPDLTIHFVTKNFTYEGFSYADFERVRLLPAEKPGGGPVLIVRFNGSVVTEVKIEGRHLHSLYHWIGLHRLPWVWEHPSPANFTDEKSAVVSRITIDAIDR